MKKIISMGLFLAIVLYLSTKQVAAAQHPNLVVNQSDISVITAKIQSKYAVQQAMAAMESQTWKNGAPSWALDEGWSREMVERAFVGYVTNNSQATNQAKTIFIDHIQGSNRYSFSVFNQASQKYIYGQPCTALVITYDLLAPQLSSQERSLAQSLLSEWGSGLAGHYSSNLSAVSHNFNTSSLACLGLIGLALEDEVSSASNWQNLAVSAFRDHFVNYAYNPGGDYTEGHVYQQYGLGPAVLFLNALERVKGNTMVSRSNLANLWNYYLAAWTSYDSFPRRGDNSEKPFLSGTDLWLLQKSSQHNLKEEYLWLWLRLRGSGASQTMYPYLFKDFDHLGMVLYYPDISEQTPNSSTIAPSFLLESVTTGTTQGFNDQPGGMAVLRSDWNTNQLSASLWLNNRWRWQNHQHYDPNSFTLEGYGQPLISYLNNRTYDDPLRGKWSQQNTIRINPLAWDSDAPISDFCTGCASSLGTFPVFFQSDIADVIVSDSQYSHANLHRQGLPNGNFSLATTSNVTPISKARRTILLVRQLLPAPVFLIYDDFKKTDVNEYWWQVYIPNIAYQISGTGSLNQPYSYRVGNAVLRMSFLNYSNPTISVGATEPGRDDHPIQLKVQQPALQLLTALLPTRATDAAPQLRQLQANPTVYEISLDGNALQIVFNPSRTTVTYQGVETNAEIALGHSWGSSEMQVLFHQATFANSGGSTLFTSATPTTQVIDSPQGICNPNPDFSGDGDVSLPDFTLMVPQLMQPVTAINQKYDLNCDAAIDLTDISILFLSWSF